MTAALRIAAAMALAGGYAFVFHMIALSLSLPTQEVPW